MQFQVAQLENSFDALLRDEAGRCHNQIAAKATIANCWVANVLCNHVCLAVCVCVRVCVWHCDVATKSHRKKLPPVLCLSSFSYSFRLWFSASVFGFSFLAFFGFAFSCCCSCQLVQPSFSASVWLWLSKQVCGFPRVAKFAWKTQLNNHHCEGLASAPMLTTKCAARCTFRASGK